jgi:hypothetical protein
MSTQSFESQAPICPYCCDDHSSLSECNEKELKKVILKKELKELIDNLYDVDLDEKDKDKLIARYEKMISWF